MVKSNHSDQKEISVCICPHIAWGQDFQKRPQTVHSRQYRDLGSIPARFTSCKLQPASRKCTGSVLSRSRFVAEANRITYCCMLTWHLLLLFPHALRGSVSCNKVNDAVLPYYTLA